MVWAIRSYFILAHNSTFSYTEQTHQISLSRLGDSTTSLVLIELKDTNLLKSLHNLTVNGSGSIGVVRWAGTTVTGGSVNLAHTSDTDCLAEVDVTSDGGGAGVEPVDGLRWEFLGRASLDFEFVSMIKVMTGREVSIGGKNIPVSTQPGIGSFPCLFKKAEYALMNACAYVPYKSALNSVIRRLAPPSRQLDCMSTHVSRSLI